MWTVASTTPNAHNHRIINGNHSKLRTIVIIHDLDSSLPHVSLQGSPGGARQGGSVLGSTCPAVSGPSVLEVPAIRESHGENWPGGRLSDPLSGRVAQRTTSYRQGKLPSLPTAAVAAAM